MARSIDNSQDIIDSRDVIARIEELESDRESLTDAVEAAQEELNELMDDTNVEGTPEARKEAQEVLDNAKQDLADWDNDYDGKELATLKAFAEECENETDWYDGATLIRDSYFTEYAEQLASDTCDMGKATDWPFRHIDWEAAADELRQDYTSVTFDGEDYLMRA